MNTTEFLNIAAAIVPERDAIVFEGRRVTYGRLQGRVRRLAGALAGLGVRSGDRVAILQVNCPEYVEAYFAAATLDAIFVPLNFRAGADEVRYMVGDAGPRSLLVGGRYADLVRSVEAEIGPVEHTVALEGEVEGWESYAALVDSDGAPPGPPAADGEDVTLIMYTAGTTGFPKGVMLSHDAFSSYMLSSVSPADPELGERNLLTVPLHHVAGMQAMMAGVYAGRTLIMQRQFDAQEWLRLAERERADRAMLVPTMLKRLMDHPDFHRHDLSSLRVITYGAAPMPLELIRRAIEAFPTARFINAFGQTETAATITALPPEDHVLEGSHEEVERKLRRLSSIGRPLDDVEVRVVDERGSPAGPGEVGEIVARGPRLMRGYWRQEAATAEAIRDGWLHTGDLGYFDQDGYLFLAGRARDFIKRGGEMVSPEEVERVLHSHPAVEEAAVIGVPDAEWGERVRAVVALKEGGVAGEEELIEHCRRRLAGFKKPESVVFVAELPRNALGKVLKRVLRERFGGPVVGDER